MQSYHSRYFIVLVLPALFLLFLFYTVSSRHPLSVQASPVPVHRAAAPLPDIVQVAAGSNHTCALTTAGAVFCWGNNEYGQLGDGTNLLRMAPTMVSGLTSGVTTIATGGDHTCAVTGSALFCWGRNNNGQLGDGSRTDRNTPTTVSGLSNGVTQLAVGRTHTCAATASAVRCWGDNTWGQLGDGSSADRVTPVLVNGLIGSVSDLVVGADHSCVRTGSGAVRCWGKNNKGQLGDGTTTDRPVPVGVSNGSSGATALVAGAAHTCARTGTTTLVCWGDNEWGQLGDGTTTNRSTPIAVSGLSGEITTLAAGGSHTCGVTGTAENATIHCWGRNVDGQLGDGTRANRISPVSVSGLRGSTIALSTGDSHTCALVGGGGEPALLHCWGSNRFGQLGYGAPNPTTPQNVVDLNDVTAISAGRNHTCALTEAGALFCWGDNTFGQLGDGTRTSHTTPVAVSGLESGVVAVRAGDDHTCAVSSGGGVQCWGGNQWGQLGDGTTTDRLTPVAVSGLTSGVRALHVGYDYTCVLTADGDPFCWGWNGSGQLGDGTREERLTPVAVNHLQGEATAITGGNGHTCALTETSDGTGVVVNCWGHNIYGQLGDGTRVDRLVPGAVAGLGNQIASISAGSHHTCALTTQGALACWGANGWGQLGDGTLTLRTSPVGVSGFSNGIATIAAGYSHTCALTTVGALFCWGANDENQLGDGTTTSRTTPLAISGLSGEIAALAAGRTHTCALIQASGANGTVHCWGSNVSGQLGNSHAWRTAPLVVINPNAPDPTPTPTTPPPTPTPVPGGDEFENDDTCQQAGRLAADGTLQARTFHRAGDVDWGEFAAEANTTYRISVDIPYGSPVDVTLNLYTDCDIRPTKAWDATFAPGAEVDISIPTAGPIFIELANQDATVGAGSFRYDLSVRALPAEPDSGAVIIVAGRLKQNDPLQRNIHNVTDRVYRIFLGQGYTNDNIYYLATDQALPGFDAIATKAGLEYAITEWAPGIVGADEPFTLYLMDHGEADQFYLNGAEKQIVTPQDLNGWLAEFEAKVPTAKVNVVIEACYIGSFIEEPNSISKANRVVITSSDSSWSAYASRDGAHFSDHFLTELQQGNNLFTSFDKAQRRVNAAVSYQNPWIDANGDRVPNQQEDFAIAAERGFAYPGTLSDGRFPPYISSATGPATIENRRGLIRAEVEDDKAVESVWAVVYAPSYQPPTSAQELLAETAPTLLLNPQGNNRYAVEYPGFDEIGNYRIVIHASDALDNLAAPLVVTTTVTAVSGSRLFLPVVMR